MNGRIITLKHLLIREKKQIGLKFYPDKVTQNLIKTLPNPRWSTKFKMVYVENTKENLNAIFNTFRGIVWVHGQSFFRTKLDNGNPLLKVTQKKVERPEGYRFCPKDYIQKLELKKQLHHTCCATALLLTC